MAYTVAKLAKISGVSVRTLHWYDKIGLLKPAYYGANGYRYYEAEQLLVLQQIFLFRELGFELKQIEALLKKNNLDLVRVLSNHRKFLESNLEKTKNLIKTIDKIIQHLKGTKKMHDFELHLNYKNKQQNDYHKYLINRFRVQAKNSIE
ncbi:MAG: MerR family transcriptional regulator [Candidatus Protochlamydia sp.]|nr:MerR family transcriptional regulator [Candidatus Protochlamydia sp.]